MASLADVLRQVGYVTPQGVTGPNAPLAQQLKNYATNVIPNARQNLAQQRADIDAALTMGQGGVQIGDREAFERQMAQVPNLMGLTAYHGTPHTIKGKFDISKVGTGEGAQAYGHGMYFAESPDVARTYATDRSYVGKFMAGTPDKTAWDAQRIAQDTLNVHGDNAVEQLQKTLKANSYSKNPQQTQANKQLEDAIDILKTNQLQPTGNLYKVDIPDEYIPNMLDYDKPLNQQTNIINNILSKNSGFTGQTKREIQELVKQGAKGEDLIKLFGKDQKELSEELSNLGIKGIRYKDAMSRGADEGTSNFVVFEPSNVKILEQNSKPMTRKEIIENQIKAMQNAGD